MSGVDIIRFQRQYFRYIYGCPVYAWNAIVLSCSRTQPSAVTERSATKLCYVFVTKPDLKTVLQNLKCLSLKREA